MNTNWPALPYDEWKATRDTLHSHTQILGKIQTKLAPPEPQLQHAALRLTARGWEPDSSPHRTGRVEFGIALDLHRHEAIVEHVDGRRRAIPLTPNRAVREVFHDVLAAVEDVAGRVEIDPKPQETLWQTALDEDAEHATYDESEVARYLVAASQAALVLATLRAPWRGRSTPVNAWWGSFDLAVSLFSGRAAEPPSKDFIFRNSMDAQEIAHRLVAGDTATAGPRSMPMRTRPERGSPGPTSRRVIGTRRSASTSSTGMTSFRVQTRSSLPPSSGARSPATRASPATGIQSSLGASKASRHQSPETQVRAVAIGLTTGALHNGSSRRFHATAMIFPSAGRPSPAACC